MGYYIEVPNKKGKAQQIVELHGGRIVAGVPSFKDISPDEAIICVLDNGAWEAAGFAYDEKELEEFAAPDFFGHQRPREWLIMSREKACELTGYNKNRNGGK